MARSTRHLLLAFGAGSVRTFDVMKLMGQGIENDYALPFNFNAKGGQFKSTNWPQRKYGRQ